MPAVDPSKGGTSTAHGTVVPLADLDDEAIFSLLKSRVLRAAASAPAAEPSKGGDSAATTFASKKNACFLREALSSDLGTVPGIGDAARKLLAKDEILTTFHLVGKFYMMDKDEVKFAGYLHKLGVGQHWGRVIASSLFLKAEHAMM
eukprot:TRINITY_DN14871_c0_g1_i1.p2 TRINITY_DN14871_c0_g1~~TRINITY_DN14871_c0_g1_i1.p2  ORF type:complete len:147 (+),score=22.12 TRINITY_DN14871_c0_g1_i1:141-581(+)